MAEPTLTTTPAGAAPGAAGRDPGGSPAGLAATAARRVLILDGALGTLVQARGLSEADVRGRRFAAHPEPLRGCCDVLCLTQPALIQDFHAAYLDAGADIIETNSFNTPAIALGGFGLQGAARELAAAAAALARTAADSAASREPRRPRYVAGSLGPTALSASLTRDMDHPGERAVTWDALVAAYTDAARGLLEGGVDLLLLETIYDSLNAKAAIFAIRRLQAETPGRGWERVPLILSATISENGRLLTGQTLDGFALAVRHAAPLALGLNCSFGAAAMKPHLARLAALAPCLVAAYPNAGFPGPDGRYTESPEDMAAHAGTYMTEGLVNIIGGCCGSTPAHIAAIARRAQDASPRRLPAAAAPGTLPTDDELFRRAGAGACQNALDQALRQGDYEAAVELLRDAVDEAAAAGAPLPPPVLRPDPAPRPRETIRSLIFLANCYPAVAALPFVLESADWPTAEAALQSFPGRALIRHTAPDKAPLLQAYGCACGW